jgi:integrase
MASVHKRVHRGRITYRAVWRESGPGGRARLRNKSFAKAADAKIYAARMEAEVERRGVGDPARHSTGQYLSRWLATLRDRGEHSLSTLEYYARCITAAKPWVGDIPLSRLSAADLDHAYGELRKRGGRTRDGKQTRPLTARTVLNVHRCLHTALEQARKWKLIAENPARDARAPSPLRSCARAFTADEVQRLLEVAAADPTTYAMVATMLTCGLRRSELIGLAFDAIDFEAGTLEVKRVGIEVAHRAVICARTKTESSARKLKIPSALVALLKTQLVRVQKMVLEWGREYQREPLFVFPGLAGVPMSPHNVTDRMRALLRRAKIAGAQPCHAWRHTAATLLLDSGQNVKTAQARLGHSTPATTLALYVHPVEERDAEAAEHLGKLIER